MLSPRLSPRLSRRLPSRLSRRLSPRLSHRARRALPQAFPQALPQSLPQIRPQALPQAFPQEWWEVRKRDIFYMLYILFLYTRRPQCNRGKKGGDEWGVVGCGRVKEARGEEGEAEGDSYLGGDHTYNIKTYYI